MTSRFLERLASGPVLFDGAMGSMLLAAGLKAGTVPEAWNVDNKEAVETVHKAYLAAGAEVITLNTFGGNPLKLSVHGLGGRCCELNLAGAERARAALEAGLDREAFIAGGLGPTGKFFPPVGDLDAAAADSAFRNQVEVLAGAGVDLILIETMSDVREAEIAVRAARHMASLPVVVTLTFDRKRRGFFTIMGDKPVEAARRLAEAGADVAGANCTLAAEDMTDLAGILAPESPVPILVQPNAGRPEMVDGETAYRVTPEAFAEEIIRILEKGVAAVGGCCGTTPDHIRAVAKRMAGRSKDPGGSS